MVDDMNCGDGQVRLCSAKMDTLLEKVTDLAQDLETQKLLEESHARELFGKIDSLKDLITGGGRSGTGIAPRLSLVELRTAENEKGISRVENKLDEHIRERTQFERKITWGIIAAIGTGCLGILTQFIGKKL
ncbi:MAG: hypothetical protein KJ050_10595 [Candidatus Omnitrophica bacterium]|nr:hypothetical protein [Candidatus Omnitrophota bacterium]